MSRENLQGHGRSARCVNCFFDKGDALSTSNLRKHAKICWGDDVVKLADETKDVRLARGIVGKSEMGNATVTAMFERAKKGGVMTYSHTQHSKTETK
jgi:hypothetical protein